MADRSPSWLDARPSVRVLWLQARNVGRRWPWAVVAGGCVFLALGALGRILAVVYLLALAALSPRAVLVVAAVIGATVMLHHRRRLEDNGHRHWLAALPADLSRTVRSAARPVGLWVVAAALIVLVSWVARLPAWVPARLIGYCAAGVALGVALVGGSSALSAGWGRGTHGKTRPVPRSRYVAVRRRQPARSGQVSLLALGGWPRAETQVRDRPTIRSRSLVLLLLAVPMGAAAGPVLAAAAAWLLILHLINLLLALARSAFGASWWLAPTPLGPLRFAVALSHRIFAAQLATSALLVAIAYVTLGAPSVRMVCSIAAAWLGAVAALGMLVCVAALRTPSIAASAPHRWRQ